jgi:hypothetical protein
MKIFLIYALFLRRQGAAAPAGRPRPIAKALFPPSTMFLGAAKSGVHGVELGGNLGGDGDGARGNHSQDRTADDGVLDGADAFFVTEQANKLLQHDLSPCSKNCFSFMRCLRSLPLAFAIT